MNDYYSIKEKELIVHNAKKQPPIIYIKYGVWCIVLFLCLCSLIFKENFFLEINKTSLWLLIALVFSTLFIKKKKIDAKSDFELRLYKDKLVLYRPKITYSKRMTRREVNTIYYNDLEDIKYNKKNNSLYIHGNVHFKWTKYNTNSSILQDVPYRDKKIDKTLCFLNTDYIDMDDFIKQVETHSNIKIIKE